MPRFCREATNHVLDSVIAVQSCCVELERHDLDCPAIGADRLGGQWFREDLGMILKRGVMEQVLLNIAEKWIVEIDGKVQRRSVTLLTLLIRIKNKKELLIKK